MAERVAHDPARRSPGRRRTALVITLLTALLVVGCEASPGGKVPSDGSVMCEEAFAAAPFAPASRSVLDGAIRRCSTLDQWGRMAVTYPDALHGADGTDLLIERCEDPLAALAGYQLCTALRTALATPAPTPRPTKAPKPTPTTRPTPRPTPRPQVGSYRTAVCGAIRTLRASARTLDAWRDLESTKQALDHELAVGSFVFEGATGEEAADRRRIAALRVEAKWQEVRRSYASDANDLLVDLAGTARSLGRDHRYPAGDTARTRLRSVSSRMSTHARAVRTWLKKHASTKKLRGIFRDLDATERDLQAAVRSLPVDCL